MNETITVYGRNYCESFVLPTVSDRRYAFRLEQKKYDGKEDIEVEMQVLDGTWCFSDSRRYRVLREKEVCFLKKLYPGDVLKFCPETGENLLFVVGAEEGTIPVFRKYILHKKNCITLGRGTENAIVLRGSTLISKEHARICFETDHWVLVDSSSNGTYINGRKVNGKAVLRYGDAIEIFGCRFIFLKDILAIRNGEEQEEVRPQIEKVDRETLKWITMIPAMTNHGDAECEIRPAPREQADYDTEEFEIEAPPAPKKQKERSLFMTLGPSLTMAVPMLIGVIVTGMGAIAVGLITMLGSGLIGAFWAYMNRKNQRDELIKDEEERFQKYSAYLQKKEEELKELYAFNRGQLEQMYPSAKECTAYGRETAGLWNRNESQEDFMTVRLGTGEVDFQKPIRIPQERFSLIHDTLADEPARIKKTYEKLRDVPVGVDLDEHGVIGIIGGKDGYGAYPVLRTMVTQIAANISYRDAKIVFLCDGTLPEEKRFLEDVKWLPHLWNDEKDFRYAGDTKESVNEALNHLHGELKSRVEQAESRRENHDAGCRYIIIAASPKLLEGNAAENLLLGQRRIPGVTLILCAEAFAQLPNACEFMIENTDAFQGMYSVKEARKNRKEIRFDTVSGEELNALSHRLAAIRVKTSELSQEIPDMVTFLDMYEAENTEDLQIGQRWDAGRSYVSMSVPVGLRSGDRECALDIHENAHGPHGLVAGTTGSGKSEMLLTWILSLAVNFSPEDVSFFLIDFKGGGMASHVEALPHVSGVITNLSENQVHRALVSIKSEIESRQGTFVRAGANDIYEYTRMYKNQEVQEPIPHLMIVVDEFAELKTKYPEFMNELISVATVGRSLGVHLILATQKPSGTVDEKIQSNSRFRICLKVQDRQDSKDMLEHYDAAYIRQKGRGYFRVGNDEIYEQFQSAWSRAPYAADRQEVQDNLAKLYTVNGNTEIVGNYQKILRREAERREWIAKLIRCVSDVLEETETTAKWYLANQETMQKVNQRMYRYFAEQGWNIERSEHNDNRLVDLFMVYDFCEKAYGMEISPEQMEETAHSMRRSFVEEGRKTQLDAVVDEVNKTAEKRGHLHISRLWLPELSDHIYLKELKEAYRGDEGLEACIGKYDDPNRQCQGTVYMDFLNQGNYIVCGSVSSGKSTLLQTMICSLITNYSPEKVNLYCLDFSSRMLEGFETAPHMGGILYEQTQEKIGKFFFLMKQLLAERKELLKGGTYSQYIQSGGKGLPAIVLVIDQYGSFREKTDGMYDSQMMELAKEGNGNGIFLVLSVSGFTGSEIPQKLADHMRGRICLELNDRYMYRDILNVSRVDIYPENGIKGRGLINRRGESLEYQTALALEAENDYERMDKIRRLCRRLREEWNREGARRIPEIPKQPSYSVYSGLEEVRALLEDDRSLPLGYDMESAMPWSLDLSKFYCYLVSGKKRSGKTNFLQMAGQMAAAKGGRIYIFGTAGSVLEKTAEKIGAAFYPMEDDYISFCTEIKPELIRRNRKKHELECAGCSDEEIYEEMKREENIYILIDDLAAFTERLYRAEEGRPLVNGFFETFSDKGRYHQIFLFAGMNQDDRFAVQGRAFYENVIRDRNGIHLGGNVGGQQLLNYEYISSFREQNQAEPLGVGTLAVGEGRMHVGKVVIPNARK